MSATAARIPKIPLPPIMEPSAELILNAKAAIAADPTIFVSRGKPVQLVEDEKRARLQPLNWSGLSALLSKSLPWKAVLTLYGLNCPPWLSNHLLKNETWSELRPIAGITDVPVLRPDGTLLTTPGYDDQTGIYFSPKLDLEPIPTEPTKEDAQNAIGDLSELLDAFPVVSKAHRSALLAALMTPFANLAIPDSSPLFLLDQPGEGNAATTAADAIGLLVSGRRMARMEMPASERRLRKQLARLDAPGESTLLLEGAHILRDPAPLETAIESTRWIDGLDEPEQKQRLVWYAHAANATMSRATAEWTLPIRFFDTDDDLFGSTFAWPAGFRPWLLANRARFIRSILIVLRAYVCAGRPVQPSERWSRFGSWRSLVGGALIWTGLEDPILARRALESATEDDNWRRFFMLLPLLYKLLPEEGLTTHEILARLKSDAWELVRDELRDFFGTAEVEPRRLGNLFRVYRGRALCGLFLHRAGTSEFGLARWTVARIPTAPSSVPRSPYAETIASHTDRICDYPEAAPSKSAESDSAISEKAPVPTESAGQPGQADSDDGLDDGLDGGLGGGLGRLAPDGSKRSDPSESAESDSAIPPERIAAAGRSAQPPC